MFEGAFSDPKDGLHFGGKGGVTVLFVFSAYSATQWVARRQKIRTRDLAQSSEHSREESRVVPRALLPLCENIGRASRQDPCPPGALVF